MKSLLVLALVLLPGALAQAQGVYVTPGENGPLFSDQLRPGARAVSLPPLTVVAPPAPAAGQVADQRDAQAGAAAFAYRAFSIVQPANYGSVLANTALFEVRVDVDPPLLLGEGHAVTVRINGRAVGVRFTASEFMIPPQFWGDVVPPPGQLQQVEASIVDRDGRELKQADPVRFFMDYVPHVGAPSPPAQPTRAVGAAIK